jgi:hypothetical protein
MHAQLTPIGDREQNQYRIHSGTWTAPNLSSVKTKLERMNNVGRKNKS